MAKKEYNYALWRRKESSAVVRLFSNGSGKITVRTPNIEAISLKDYFGGNKHLYENAISAFETLWKDLINKFDAEINIHGGWISGQADAIKLWFSRALIDFDADYRPTLKPHGLLRRDARIKERKKPGLKKARKAPTWSKR